MLENFKNSVKEFSSELKSKVTEKEIDEETLEPLLEDLRLKLLQNNVSLEAAEEIQRNKIEDKVNEALREVLEDLLNDDFNLEKELDKASEPPTVFFIGFNGSGKTTTTAKMAKKLEDRGVVMGAGDTFRAASIEQLEKHGENLDVKVISHEYESDPAAVGYDTVEHAEKNDKVALIDTAGRSHSNENLMDELQKMIRVNEPDLTFLVVDALSGNDVLQQAEAYEGMYDAIIVTKMDVDKDGGVIISISNETGKPVAFLGTGQDYNDLKVFDKDKFIEDILEED
ncbi:MAG: signal recognition particle receptor subunit alpha [Candidatus Nanohaloarchaea archaeon]